MPITVSTYSGSLAFGATETSLISGAVGSGTATGTGSVQVTLDLRNLQNRSLYALRIRRAVTATCAKALLYYDTFGNAQPASGYVSPSLLLGHAWDATVQNLGTTTDVQIPYSVDIASAQGAVSQTAAVVAYSTVSGLSGSTQYTVSVNGVAVPTTKFDGHSYAWFAFETGKSVTVSIDCGQTVSSYVLSPQRIAPSSSISGATVSFALTQAAKLLLRSVNALTEQLTILADPLESSVPASSGTGIYNVVTQYSVPINNTGDAATGINSAITAANSAGGGVVYCPAGQYRINTSVVLKTNVSVYLAPGAVWRLVPSSQGGTNFTSGTVIQCNGVTDGKIYGRGVIYGQGLIGASAAFPLQTLQCTRLQILDVMFIDGAQTTIGTYAGTNDTISNVKIITSTSGLMDGIDFGGGSGGSGTTTNSGLTIQDCLIRSSDDLLALASGTCQMGGGTPGNTSNVTMRRNFLCANNQGHLLSIVPHWGSTTISQYSINGVSFLQNDAILLPSSITSLFSIYPWAGFAVTNVTYDTCRVEVMATEPYQKFVDFLSVDCTGWGQGNCSEPWPDTAAIKGPISTILLKDITVDGAYGSYNSAIYGIINTISGLTFNNVVLGNGTHVTNTTNGHLDVQGSVSGVTYV